MIHATDLHYSDGPRGRVIWYENVARVEFRRRPINWPLFGLAVLLAWLSGCTHIERKVEGLDGLRTTEHIVSPGEIWTRCRKYSPGNGWLMQPLACAEISFTRWTCDYYITATTAADTIEHERLHCQGWDHGGEIQRAYDKWREK